MQCETQFMIGDGCKQYSTDTAEEMDNRIPQGCSSCQLIGDYFNFDVLCAHEISDPTSLPTPKMGKWTESLCGVTKQSFF